VWYEWLFSMVFAFAMVAFGETLKWCYRSRDRDRARVARIDEGFSTMMLEIRNLRHHVERLEGKLATDMQQLRLFDTSHLRSSTSSSSGKTASPMSA
jgi:hypothetical protein